MKNDEPDWTGFWNKKITFSSFLFYRIYEKFRVRSYFRLLKNIDLKGKGILELGGGSGYICKLICERYGCKGTLIDNNRRAYEIFKKVVGNKRMKYILTDMFGYRGEHDLVFSDGLIEHFHKEKRREIILLHKKFAKRGGFVIFFAPKKSWLVEKFISIKEGYEEKMSMEQLKRETSVPGLKMVSSTEDLHMIGVLYRVD